MDQSFLGLCYRLYNFIMNCLAKYAMKTVTLGRGSHQGLAQLPSSGAASDISSSLTGQATDPLAQETPIEDASLQAEVAADNHKNVEEMVDSSISSPSSKEEQNEEETVSTIAPEAQPPKKMVSINDTVEEIAASRNKSKKKKRTEKVGSFDQEIDEPKPLKSILKKRSKLDENSYINPSNSLGPG